MHDTSHHACTWQHGRFLLWLTCCSMQAAEQQLCCAAVSHDGPLNGVLHSLQTLFVRFGDPVRPGLLDALGMRSGCGGRQIWPWLGAPDVYSVTQGATQVSGRLQEVLLCWHGPLQGAALRSVLQVSKPICAWRAFSCWVA